MKYTAKQAMGTKYLDPKCRFKGGLLVGQHPMEAFTLIHDQKVQIWAKDVKFPYSGSVELNNGRFGEIEKLFSEQETNPDGIPTGIQCGDY